MTKGDSRMLPAGIPSSRCIIVLLPAMVALTMSLRLGLHAVAGGDDQAIDGVQHAVTQLFRAAFLGRIHDSRDHIFAAGDLAVVFRDLCLDLPADQVHQPQRDGRGADIDGGAPQRRILIDEARAAGRSIAPCGRRRLTACVFERSAITRDSPVAIAQGCAQPLQQSEGGAHIARTDAAGATQSAGGPNHRSGHPCWADSARRWMRRTVWWRRYS